MKQGRLQKCSRPFLVIPPPNHFGIGVAGTIPDCIFLLSRLAGGDNLFFKKPSFRLARGEFGVYSFQYALLFLAKFTLPVIILLSRFPD